MKIAVFFREGGFMAALLRLFTGLNAYHVGFVDEASGKLYDMHLIRRRREWPHATYSASNGVRRFELFDVPGAGLDAVYLERQLDRSVAMYGFVDYMLFALRPLYHLLGRNTRNAGGVICSEMVNDDLRACGISTPWGPADPPPSPADLHRWLTELATP